MAFVVIIADVVIDVVFVLVIVVAVGVVFVLVIVVIMGDGVVDVVVVVMVIPSKLFGGHMSSSSET